jgi:hypothetical protein
VYVNDDTGDFYYYDPETAATTYLRPEDSLLLDPDTGLAYQFPDPPTTPRCAPLRMSRPQLDSFGERRARPRSRPALKIDVPPDIRQIRRLERHGQVLPRLVTARPTSFIPDPTALALPGDPTEETSRFKVAEYASDFIQLQIGADQVFQTDPITTPLLLGSAGGLARQALESFKLILSYTGADCPPPPPRTALPTLRRLLKLGVDCPDLIDEIFFQLVKQTRKNNDPECALRTWELFLIVASALPSTRNSEHDIKSHLACHARSRAKNLATIAQFTYIRYDGRCKVGKPMDDAANISAEVVARFLRDPFDGHVCFGVTVTEQLWHQRKTAPICPIPLILRDLAHALLERGGRSSVGVFRMSGSALVVAELTAQLNGTADRRPLLQGVAVNDIAQLIKQWFATLPGRLINADSVDGLRTVFETSKNYVQFVERLPAPEYAALKFLIGLIRELVKNEAVTKMGVQNYAIVLGSAVVAHVPTTDQKDVLKQTEIGQDFIAGLIERWETTDVWPFPQAWLARA